MKKKRIVLGILLVFFCNLCLICRAADPVCKNKEMHSSHESGLAHDELAKKMNLSPKQQELHKKITELHMSGNEVEMKKLHDQFVKSLSKEQKELLEACGHKHAHMIHGVNADHDEIGRKMNLSDEQLKLHNLIIELHAEGKEEEMKKAHDQFVSSLTDEQKQLLQKLAHQ